MWLNFSTKTPEELKLFINQSYAAALLDQKITNAPDLASAWTSPLDTLSYTMTGFKLIASAKAADLGPAPKKPRKYLECAT
jgi:hypothetical protein